MGDWNKDESGEDYWDAVAVCPVSAAIEANSAAEYAAWQDAVRARSDARVQCDLPADLGGDIRRMAGEYAPVEGRSGAEWARGSKDWANAQDRAADGPLHMGRCLTPVC